ncbi:phosphatidyl-N-methylethanolamine N-methyltransferase-like [Zingiber officinale]|uniref:phosphatidyl-N-methylethanolamine N-methyltransferase-like n=1 Tax=Zingiber officinale TaxID=94328 RepID=UPI001C4C2C26|nr:phosphatidyl-N-methylethanolamine N-methyltransferase-like [Zingiber officinale]
MEDLAVISWEVCKGRTVWIGRKPSAMNSAAVLGVLLPFPFYYILWNYPQAWVDLCGKGVDPSHRMAQISHVLKAIQFVSLFSVASFSRPPWYCLLLFLVGQFLNFKVYQLLGEAGTYYGVRFGKNLPWVTEFPFGYIKDPQYVGSILSLVACLCWVPLAYIVLWIVGYLLMMQVEASEDSATRAKPLH